MPEGKGGLSLDRSIREERRLCDTIDGIFAVAKRESWPWARILETRAKRVHEDPIWKRMPERGKAHVNAYFSAYLSALHTLGLIVWALRIDGTRVVSSEVHGPEQWARVTGAHEWAHSCALFDAAREPVMAPP